MRPLRYSLSTLLLAITLVAYCFAFPMMREVFGALAVVVLVLLALIAVQWPIVWLLKRARFSAAADEMRQAD